MGKKLLPALILLLLAAQHAPALDLTTRLLTAKPGSWTRRLKPHSRSETFYVAAVTDSEVVVQVLLHHGERLAGNRRYRVPAAYIREHAADPGSPAARSGRVDHKGAIYDVKIVTASLGEADGDFYISDVLPANGVLRVDILAGAPYTLWTDEYGETPDRLILEAGPGEDAGGPPFETSP